jgi:hypothetical protein
MGRMAEDLILDGIGQAFLLHRITAVDPLLVQYLQFRVTGRPNHALPLLPRAAGTGGGLSESTAGNEAQNIDQPPWPVGSRLAGRSTAVPQSIDCSSTAMPILSSVAMVRTGSRLVRSA